MSKYVYFKPYNLEITTKDRLGFTTSYRVQLVRIDDLGDESYGVYKRDPFSPKNEEKQNQGLKWIDAYAVVKTEGHF